MLERGMTWRDIAYLAGRRMRERGRPLSLNPWPPESDGYREWSRGWRDEDNGQEMLR